MNKAEMTVLKPTREQVKDRTKYGLSFNFGVYAAIRYSNLFLIGISILLLFFDRKSLNFTGKLCILIIFIANFFVIEIMRKVSIYIAKNAMDIRQLITELTIKGEKTKEDVEFKISLLDLLKKYELLITINDPHSKKNKRKNR